MYIGCVLCIIELFLLILFTDLKVEKVNLKL